MDILYNIIDKYNLFQNYDSEAKLCSKLIELGR